MRQLIHYIARLTAGLSVWIVAALLGLAGLLIFVPRLLLQAVRWVLVACCLGAAVIFLVNFVRGLLDRG